MRFIKPSSAKKRNGRVTAVLIAIAVVAVLAAAYVTASFIVNSHLSFEYDGVTFKFLSAEDYETVLIDGNGEKLTLMDDGNYRAVTYGSRSFIYDGTGYQRDARLYAASREVRDFYDAYVAGKTEFLIR